MECLTDGGPLPKTRWTRVEENGREMVLDLTRFKVVSGKGTLYKIKLQMNKDYLNDYHPQLKVAIDGILFLNRAPNKTRTSITSWSIQVHSFECRWHSRSTGNFNRQRSTHDDDETTSRGCCCCW